MPSFELKLRRNAWVARALPPTALGQFTLTALPRPLARLRGSTSKREGRGEGREGERKDTPTLGEKVTPLLARKTYRIRSRVAMHVRLCVLGRKLCRYNWHSADSLGWPFPVLECKYIFQIKYIEAILSNSTLKQLWFEITKMLTAVEKINLLCYLL